MSARTKKKTSENGMRHVAEQLLGLRTMTVDDLRQRYEELFGVPTRTRNKTWLVKKVGWRIQELAEGGLSEPAVAKIDELADHVPVRHNRPSGASTGAERDPRLPPLGSVIVRPYKGVEHRVTVVAGGFEYGGEKYTSLSAVALKITGTVWNGLLFFGLKKRGKGGAA